MPNFQQFFSVHNPLINGDLLSFFSIASHIFSRLLRLWNLCTKAEINVIRRLSAIYWFWFYSRWICQTLKTQYVYTSSLGNYWELFKCQDWDLYPWCSYMLNHLISRYHNYSFENTIFLQHRYYPINKKKSREHDQTTTPPFYILIWGYCQTWL